MSDSNHSTEQINLTYDLIKYSDNDYFEFIYRGHFSENITENILNLNEAKFVSDKDVYVYRNRVSYFLIESLQNVIRHQNLPDDDENISSEGLLVIQKTSGSLFLTTANVIDNEKIPVLESYLNKIKKLSPEELKTEYQKILLDGVITDKGGGGLGIITMARRTEGKINYKFKKIDDRYSYYYYQIELVIKEAEMNEKVSKSVSLERISTFHELLNSENILLNFNGSLAFKNLESLLPVIESHSMGGKAVQQKVFDLTVKLIKNIIDFADDFSDENSDIKNRRGVYLLSRENKKLYLTAANVILKEKSIILGNKINMINKISEKSLVKIKDYLVEFFKTDLSKKPDINLIDMRLKNNGNKIKYIFKKITPDLYYLILQLVID